MGPLTEKFGVGLEAQRHLRTNPPNHPERLALCEVEVDPETGEVGSTATSWSTISAA